MTDRAPTPLTDEEIADAIRDGESILASGNRGAWAFSVELTVAGMRELQASRAKLGAWEPVVRAACVWNDTITDFTPGSIGRANENLEEAVIALPPEMKP